MLHVYTQAVRAGEVGRMRDGVMKRGVFQSMVGCGNYHPF